MSVEAIGNTSIKASETKLPTMPKVNMNVQKSQAAAKMSQGINTDPSITKAISTLPSLEAISAKAPPPKRTLSVKKTTESGQISKNQPTEQTQRADETDRNVESRQDKAAQESKQEQKYREVMTEKAVENANNRVRATRTNAKFEYNEDIKRITITIMDENQEVIKEIPPEETQKMLERLHTFTGMMLDQDV